MAKQKPSKRKAEPLTLFEKVNVTVEKYLQAITLTSLGLFLLFSVIVFNTSFSIEGDDSTYVVRAWELIHNFTFPGFQGPVYPLTLVPVVALFGISAIPLKGLSMIFLAGFIWFTYKAFRGRIPAILLAAIIVLVSLNFYFHYFASQTNSENLFLLILSLLLFVFFRYFIDPHTERPFRKHLLLLLLLAGLAILLGLTRPVGFAAAGVVMLYFLLHRQWKDLGFFLLFTIAVFLLFQGLKFVIWGSSEVHLTGQASALLSKNYYDPGAGAEDLAGFAKRLVINSNVYLSIYFYILIGIRPIGVEQNAVWMLTVLTYLLLFASILMTWKKNKYLLFTGISSAIFLIGSFIILQTYWGQPRLLFPYMPHLLLSLLATIYYLLDINALKKFQFVFLILISLLVLFSLATSIKSTGLNREHRGIGPVFTPDWQHYIQISQWAEENLPKEAVVACRKPSISFINTHGRSFHGIMQVAVSSSGPFFERWKNNLPVYVTYQASEINGKPLPPEFSEIIRRGFVAMIYTGKESFYVVDIPVEVQPRLSEALQGMNVRPKTDIGPIIAEFQAHAGQSYVAQPDTLLSKLIQAKVSHVILAQLRGKPKEKSDRTINTMEMYMSIIALKYPNLMEQLAQAGENTDEPAGIFRLRYDKYGIALPASGK